MEQALAEAADLELVQAEKRKLLREKKAEKNRV